MKKLIVLSFCLLICSGTNCVLASSYTNAKYKYSGYSKTIKQNNRKISSIKTSKYLSNSEKKRQINKLERENYYIKRKQDSLKKEYPSL